MGKKRWSTIIEEHGVRVRLYERPGSDNIYREVRKPDGSKDRKSLGISDREKAVEAAETLCREIADLRINPGKRDGPATVTLRQLRRLYLETGPKISDKRRGLIETTLDLFEEYLGPDYSMIRFSDNTARAYADARAKGDVVAEGKRATDSPGPGTIRNELSALSTICKWAAKEKDERGRARYLETNPVRDTYRPTYDRSERRRPRMTRERYDKLMGVADEIDPEGRLRCMFVLAWETGRRINALRNLRVSDYLADPDAIRAALAEAGHDEGPADRWPAAIRWRAEFDKKNTLRFAPINARAQKAIEDYLRRSPRVGEAWLFPRPTNPEEAIPKGTTRHWLRRAEDAAGVPHILYGGWHMFRRAWAHARKDMPVQDVMAAGGWADPAALQDAYQAADAKHMLDVVNK